MCFGDGVLFAERANESFIPICLSPSGMEAKGNQVLKARFPSFGKRLVWKDPKPSELAMARVSLVEKQEEARTREWSKTLG